MRLSAKHKQEVVSYGNFTGGLNTTTVPEMIAENQMAECVNMEFNRTTGALQNCCGTATVYVCPDTITIDKLWYDEINNVFLYTDKTTRFVYMSRLIDMDGSHEYDRTKVGVLSGDMPPSAVMWDKGLLIASGGRLQYWDGENLTSIKINFLDDMNKYPWKKIKESEIDSTTHTVSEFWEADKEYKKDIDVVMYDGGYYLCQQDHTSISDAPVVCNGVFVKNGRVYIWHDYRLVASGVGDERCWYDISSDDSTSKWIDVGYKEGDKEKAYIAGACALSSDIVIIKNDGKVYRLTGDYPQWALKEIARNLTPLNTQCFTAVQDGVFIVGREGMWLLQTTVDYGDVRPTNVAQAVMGLLGTLSIEDSYVKFLPALNQIWVAGFGNKFIVFDLNFKAFFQRKFNSPVHDICLYKEYFMLTREHKITELMQGIFQDEKFSEDESDMEWKIVAKSHTSFWEFLLKRMRLTYVPLMDEFDTAQLITAEDKIKIDIPPNRVKATPIYEDERLIYDCKDYIFPVNTQFCTKWMVYRDRKFGIKLEGKGSAIMINRIDSAITEV